MYHFLYLKESEHVSKVVFSLFSFITNHSGFFHSTATLCFWTSLRAAGKMGLILGYALISNILQYGSLIKVTNLSVSNQMLVIPQ